MSKTLELIDQYLVTLTGRELVSTAEVSDLLLDVRLVTMREEGN
jgi:hypothetical protein